MAQDSAMEVLDRPDIQGLILRAYPEFHEARYYLLEIRDPDAFKAWLAERLDRNEVTTGADRLDGRWGAFNLAFTRTGLWKLGVDPDPAEQKRDGFSLEFREGLTMESRSRILGDVGPSDPKEWLWGGPGGETPEHTIDCLCLTFAMRRGHPDVAAWPRPPIDTLWEGQKGREDRKGLCPEEEAARVVRTIDANLLDGKEPFGFRDGISQPIIRFTKRDYETIEPDRSLHVVEPGEFILGYENEQGEMPLSPSVLPERDVCRRLQPLEKRPRLDDRAFRKDLRDFGRNGTYLVMRQLRQHVREFNCFLEKTAGPDEKEQHALAAKIVGRWREGRPLTVSLKEDPNESSENDFSYFPEDRYGFRCPIGAHIRRANPRDTTAGIDGRKQALRRVNRHRLLRRGRVYGSPQGSGECGLVFICLNTDLRRQFEFVQQSWVFNNKFDGLVDERDPLVAGAGPFTIQGAEGHQQISGLARFVTVRGGAYFFMPGLAALRCLADSGQEDSCRRTTSSS